MKILLIGGTGRISAAVTRLALQMGIEVYLLNRGNRSAKAPEGVVHLRGDINDEAQVASLLKEHYFDAVANFINFVPSQVERDIRLFAGRTNQYLFISSASAYQKPLSNFKITESTPLANPFWEYSRNKIVCEELLMAEHRKTGFPVTIVRPSHTYDETTVPVGIHGQKGSWQVMKRMIEGKPILVHGDGLSLWTLTHSDDFAKGFNGLLGNVRTIGEAIHITSDESLTWNTIHNLIARELGVKPKFCHVTTDFLAKADPGLEGALMGDKSHSVVFDNSKIKSLVPDFAATIRFDIGIREPVAYFLANKEMQQEDPDFDRFTEKVIRAMDEAGKTLVND